jgi:hypothetical protein
MVSSNTHILCIRYNIYLLLKFSEDQTGHRLKVLSSEMDPAEIRLIRKIFIKGTVAGPYTRTLFVTQDKRHLFVTP